MKMTDAKVKRILEKDYSGSVIRKDQEWYIGRGVYLEHKDTKDHLLNVMEACKEAVESAQLLRNTIDEELRQYPITDGLYISVLNLSEVLSIIEIYAQDYIHAYQEINRIQDELRADYLDGDEFERSAPTYEISSDDLPF